eukprot:8787174-Pyramimonas_sp.AAC.1
MERVPSEAEKERSHAGRLQSGGGRHSQEHGQSHAANEDHQGQQEADEEQAQEISIGEVPQQGALEGVARGEVTAC